MIARNTIIAASAVVLLTACKGKETCTKELAQQKATEMATKVQSMAASDPMKLQAFALKAQEIQEKITQSPEEACDFIDELIASLDEE